MAKREGRSFWTNPWTCGVAGCCLGCVLIPVIFVAAVGGGAYWMMARSGALGVRDEAIARARAHPQVVEALGEPMEVGWLRDSSIHIDDDFGRARFSLPLSGPLGSGRLHVEAERRDDDWEIQTMELDVEGRAEPIDLLAGEPPPLAESPGEP
jgi:hypothetical protein